MKSSVKNFDLIVVGGGKSLRMGFDKLRFPLADKILIERTVSAFRGADGLATIIVAGYYPPAGDVVRAEPGRTRHASVANALKKCKSEYVLVHDGSRPFVSKELIERVFMTAAEYGSAVPCLEETDSLRKTNGENITGAADRKNFVRVQTPQGFETKKLKEAFAAANREDYTDESEVYAEYFGSCRAVKGETANKKVTYPGDLFGINAKIGIGADLHRFAAGRPLYLCGIRIPHPFGLIAHSDGDAPLHALCDALLSAAGEKDIGARYPDTDDKYKDISSTELLKDVLKVSEKKNLQILSVSIVIIAEEPRLRPHIDAMRKNLSEILKIPPSDIGITATTAEKSGPVGRGEALASVAAVTLN